MTLSTRPRCDYLPHANCFVISITYAIEFKVSLVCSADFYTITSFLRSLENNFQFSHDHIFIKIYITLTTQFYRTLIYIQWSHGYNILHSREMQVVKIYNNISLSQQRLISLHLLSSIMHSLFVHFLIAISNFTYDLKKKNNRKYKTK